MSKPFYITTPIYYVNDKPHVGHAYTTIACDVLARFKRLDGYDVQFLTGTDEHGQKVQKAAEAKGIDPQSFTDGVSQNFRDLAQLLQATNTDFIRTTEQRHTEACQELWRRIAANTAPDGKPNIELGSYAGWYAVRDEAYYTEAELTDGPDGQKLAPTGAPVEWVEEPSYFFRLSAWQDALLDFYAQNPGSIQPQSRYNEVKSFVEGGLKDLSISRTTFDWGIPVPDDPDHIMYVWIDALTNYMTALGFPDKSGAYGSHWPADFHVVGKDIIRFHCVYWPAFLMAAGLKPAKSVFAHGWWTIEGQKMSKSLGNAIDPVHLIETYGLDQVRYFLLREVPFGADGDFSVAALLQRANGELANDFGNLAQRVLSMIHKNCEGKVPAKGPVTDDDTTLAATLEALLDRVRGHMEQMAFNLALDDIWTAVRACNAYVDAQAPWVLKKEDPERMAAVLYVLAESIRRLAVLMQPFTPNGCAAILEQLCVEDGKRDFSVLDDAHALTSGTELPKPTPAFPRLDVPEEGA